MSTSPTPHRLLRPRLAGMTMIEVIISMFILALAMGGFFSAQMQSRRLTDASVTQNSALTIVQGYMEQMKNMELSDLVGSTDGDGNPKMISTSPYAVPTRYDDATSDPLTVVLVLTGSGVTPPALSSLTPGVTPAGAVDNLHDYPARVSAVGMPANTTWAAIWPGARNFPDLSVTPLPPVTPRKADLHMNIWVWINDLTATTTNATQVFGITLIYTYQAQDGGRTRYLMGTVRTIRSSVHSY